MCFALTCYYCIVLLYNFFVQHLEPGTRHMGDGDPGVGEKRRPRIIESMNKAWCLPSVSDFACTYHVYLDHWACSWCSLTPLPSPHHILTHREWPTRAFHLPEQKGVSISISTQANLPCTGLHPCVLVCTDHFIMSSMLPCVQQMSYSRHPLGEWGPCSLSASRAVRRKEQGVGKEGTCSLL